MKKKSPQFRLRPIAMAAPVYPKAAGRQTGEVLVSFTVSPTGGVEKARVVRGNPPRVFESSALTAVRSWRFEAPGRSVRTTRLLHFAPKL